MKQCYEGNRALRKRPSGAAQFGPPLDPWPSGKFKAELRRRLLKWYRRHARQLPWRNTRDPYAIWISEVMLQQTQVATVIPYYLRFMARFATASELAAADEQEVLRLWEGLGYYRRARQLHAAARHVVDVHGGAFPRDLESVRRLPGIGRYTAGAILSLAFDVREPIVEANTSRLFARLLGYRGDLRSSHGRNRLWAAAEAILPMGGSGEVNQALMELGSQLCTPRRANCNVCPLASHCVACRKQLQEAIPQRARKPQTEKRREAAVVVQDGNRVLLVKRAAGQRWGGLWDFPRFLISGDSDPTDTLTIQIADHCAVRVEIGCRIAAMNHTVTRFRISLDVFAARRQGRAASRKSTLDATAATAATSQAACRLSGRQTRTPKHPPFAEIRWIPTKSLVEYPLNKTGREIANLVLRSPQRRTHEPVKHRSGTSIAQ